MPDQIHEIGRVFAIVDRESGAQADLGCAFAQQARADAVKTYPPSRDPRRASPASAPSARHAMRSTRRRISAAARRENVSSRIRRGSTPFASRWVYAMGEGVGFTGTGARDDQERRGDVRAGPGRGGDAVFHGFTLLGRSVVRGSRARRGS